MAGPAYCLLTSAIATHTFGMRYYYAILSAPYVAILLSRGALGWLGPRRPGLRSLGWMLLTMQTAMMAASVASFYTFGYHGNRSPEVIAPFARTVNHLRKAAPDARILIIHGSARDAMSLNLHLSDANASVPQVIETLSPYRHAVVASMGGIPRIIMRLQ
ncbi:MAG: hypothetical protein IPJ85_11515 [Flavobacteriales bacterium]|nr:hypothetical protein [Flavobacteriales bacterium]